MSESSPCATGARHPTPPVPRSPVARSLRRSGGPGSPRRAGLLAAAVVTLAVSGLPAPVGAAAAGDDRADPVAAALEDARLLDAPADVARLADATEGHAGVAVGVVVDPDGTGPRTPRVERIVADRDQVAELVDRAGGVPGVFSAAREVPVRALGDPLEPQQYGPATVRANAVPAGLDGSGVTVAVVDSGVVAGHADLATPLPDGRPRVLTGRAFLTGDPGDGGPGDVDPNGHGTHVAGIVAAARNGVGGAGVAPGAQVLPVRVLNSSGSGSSADLTAAILWAHQQGADVVNLSLGAPGGIPSDVAAAVDHVTTDTSRGKAPTIVVASAGNYGAGSEPVWPARHARAIAVAATDATDTVAAFSSHGSYVDVAAPGVSILSTCRTGGWCRMSGTSMASPLAAGVAALLRQQAPTRGPDDVLTALRATAHDVHTPGVDVATGWGRIDAAAAAGSPLPPTPAPVPAHGPVPLTGALEGVTVDRRTIAVGGWVSDPDGTPVVRVLAWHRGQLGIGDVAAGGGRFGHSWVASPGTHDVCAVGVDVPTGSGVLLGCRQVVVK